MAKIPREKIIPPPDRTMSDMDTFPRVFWMAPWFESRDITSGDIAFPAWMNEDACEQIMRQLPVDTDQGARWWSKLWEDAPEGALDNPEFLMISVAMAATMGWDKVVENLLDIGAPISTLEKPKDGWRWLFEERRPKLKLQKTSSALELCAWSMAGNSTAAPLHPGRAKCLDILIERGAKPSDITWPTAYHLLNQGKIIKKFIDSGLLATHSSTDVDRCGAGKILMDVLFSSDITLSNAARGRVLKSFIENGMPVQIAPGKPSLMGYIASSVAGLSQIEIALDHPDKQALSRDLIEHMTALEKRGLRMNAESAAHFKSRVLEPAVLSAETPQVQEVSRARPRL